MGILPVMIGVFSFLLFQRAATEGSSEALFSTLFCSSKINNFYEIFSGFDSVNNIVVFID